MVLPNTYRYTATNDSREHDNQKHISYLDDVLPRYATGFTSSPDVHTAEASDALTTVLCSVDDARSVATWGMLTKLAELVVTIVTKNNTQ